MLNKPNFSFIILTLRTLKSIALQLIYLSFNNQFIYAETDDLSFPGNPVQKIDNNNFESFFNEYLHTNKRLPLNGKFKFIEH